MPTIYVDNRPYPVEEGQNLLQACLSLGFNLPYFCWHPAMHSVGACRQCAVKQFKDEKDTRGRIVMACMTPAAEGTRISIDDPDARAFRTSVIEWLMLNHPHDCPVCDEGGECHLQDMTYMTGHVYRRFRFKKRTYRNQYLGPFINHELNRCIQCYRCVRYYRDYAGGRDLDVFAVHDAVYFGRYEDGVLENEFSGNLVEVCPVGVFTDKTFSYHYTRKWDLQTAPSICVHCSVGCNTVPGERYDTLRRIRNRFNGDVNGDFLCDRGRFGYEFVNHPLRIREPIVRGQGSGDGGQVHSTQHPALGTQHSLERVAAILAESRGVIGIGSPRASLEANFALRTLVGPENFYLGVAETESRTLPTLLRILREGPAPSASLEAVRSCDAVFVLGEDVTNVAPVLALALRQSVRNQPMKRVLKLKIPEWNDAAVREVIGEEKGPLFVATVAGTKLEEVATRSYHGAPEDLARLGFAVARAIGDEDRPEGVLDQVRSAAENVAEIVGGEGLADEVQDLAGIIARTLVVAEKPLVVAGTSLGSEAILHAAANVAWALRAAGRPAQLSFTVPECNSMGLGLMGGGSLQEAFSAVQEGRADTVVVLENDLYRRADASAVDAFFQAARHVLTLDYLNNATTERSEVVLPAATFAESDGTFVNQEGRAQRFYQVFVPLGAVQESWRWLRDMMAGAGRLSADAWPNLDAITATMIQELPIFGPVADIAPPADFRIAGMKIARQTHRFSGRTAITANMDVSEPKPPDDPDTPFVFSMEGYQGQPPPALIPRFWAPGWNSEQALNKFQAEVPGPLRGGNPGKRLIETQPTARPAAHPSMPAPFEPRPGEWMVLPLFHIFGSEELSILSGGIAERAPEPYLALSPVEGERHRLKEGEEVELLLGGRPRRLVVRFIPSLPPGVAGVPAGLPALNGAVLPAWVRWTGRSRAEGGAGGY